MIEYAVSYKGGVVIGERYVKRTSKQSVLKGTSKRGSGLRGEECAVLPAEYIKKFFVFRYAEEETAVSKSDT